MTSFFKALVRNEGEPTRRIAVDVSGGEPTRALPIVQQPAPEKPRYGYLVVTKYRNLDWRFVTRKYPYSDVPQIFPDTDKAEECAKSEASNAGYKALVLEARIVSEWEGYGGVER